jgi:hypothetical protein
MLEGHELNMDGGELHVHITCRPQRQDFQTLGAFGVAMERWAHQEDVRNRFIDKKFDVIDSQGRASADMSLDELKRRLLGGD